MTIEGTIKVRHSVRAYKAQPLAEDIVKALEKEIDFEVGAGKDHFVWA